MNSDRILIELVGFAESKNLVDVEPRIISDSANLIVHLFPYDIVAKVAVHDYKTAGHKDCIIKEIAVANYLRSKNVPVIEPYESIDLGPYECCGHWFSLWKYEENSLDLERCQF